MSATRPERELRSATREEPRKRWDSGRLKLCIEMDDGQLEVRGGVHAKRRGLS